MVNYEIYCGILEKAQYRMGNRGNQRIWDGKYIRVSDLGISLYITGIEYGSYSMGKDGI